MDLASSLLILILFHFKTMCQFCTVIQGFSQVFRGYRNETLAWNGLKYFEESKNKNAGPDISLD